MRFGLKILRELPRLSKTGQGKPVIPESLDAGELCPYKIFGEMEWGDVWEDGKMREVLQYLRGSKLLRMPEEVKRLFPKSL